MSREGLHERSIRREDDREEKPSGGIARSSHRYFTPPKGADIKPLLLAVAIPLILGTINGVVNNPNQDFYRNLKKPSWNPPGWLFGAAWSILYPAMGFASWLLWKQGGFKRQRYTLGLYALQLGVNLLWPVLFFGFHSILLALVDIAALDVLLVACVLSFRAVDRLAGALFLSYLAWVAFATLLNYRILVLNK